MIIIILFFLFIYGLTLMYFLDFLFYICDKFDIDEKDHLFYIFLGKKK